MDLSLTTNINITYVDRSTIHIPISLERDELSVSKTANA